MAYNPTTLTPGYTFSLHQQDVDRGEWRVFPLLTGAAHCKPEFTWWLPAPAVKRWARRTSLRRRAAAHCQTCPAASWGASPAPPSDGPGPGSSHWTRAQSNASRMEERRGESQRGALRSWSGDKTANRTAWVGKMRGKMGWEGSKQVEGDAWAERER